MFGIAQGIATVAAVDCDATNNQPLCGEYGVQGFPTLKVGQLPMMPVTYTSTGSCPLLHLCLLCSCCSGTQKAHSVWLHSLLEICCGLHPYLQCIYNASSCCDGLDNTLQIFPASKAKASAKSRKKLPSDYNGQHTWSCVFVKWFTEQDCCYKTTSIGSQ